MNKNYSLSVGKKRIIDMVNSIITEFYGEFGYPSPSWGWTSSSEKGKNASKKGADVRSAGDANHLSIVFGTDSGDGYRSVPVT
jgi:hypothetical protein